MNTVIQTKNVFFPAVLQEKVEKQVTKLASRYSKLLSLSTSIERDERNWFTVLMHARIPKKTLVIKTTKPQLTSAITESLRSLARAVRKTKEYRRDRFLKRVSE